MVGIRTLDKIDKVKQVNSSLTVDLSVGGFNGVSDREVNPEFFDSDSKNWTIEDDNEPTVPIPL
jgi:hypothetical protein